MNFSEVMIILEEDAESMATTFDVYKDKTGVTFVRFNNKVMTLVDFVKKASGRDPEAVQVLSKLKQHPKFKQAGDLKKFLTEYLKDDDGKLDLYIGKSITRYDDNEIRKNADGIEAAKPNPPKYFNPRNVKPLPSRAATPSSRPSTQSSSGYTTKRIVTAN